MHYQGIIKLFLVLLSTAAATHSSSIIGQSVLTTTPGLKLHGLDETVCSLLASSLALSTMRTYRSGLSCFLSFCQHEKLPSFPLSKSTLCRFVAYLFNQSISSSSIHLYLSALRFFQIEQGGQDPSMLAMPQLCYVLCSTARQQATCVCPARLPTTIDILHQLFMVWSICPGGNHVMSGMYPWFFGFFTSW